MATTIPTLEVPNPCSRKTRAQRTQQVAGQVDHEKRQANRIRHRGLLDPHEVLQTEVLFGIPKRKLDLEAQSVIVDQRLGREKQVTAKQNDMPHAPARKVCLLDH